MNSVVMRGETEGMKEVRKREKKRGGNRRRERRRRRGKSRKKEGSRGVSLLTVASAC